jgi:antitoxin VapB
LALSIRNPETERLARELAAASGETITMAITRALAKWLERLRDRATGIDMAEELLKISKRCRAFPDKDKRPTDEILGYNAAGAAE